MQRPFPNGHKYPFGCNVYVTAVAAGQSQRFYSGVGIFNWYYLSSPPKTLLRPVVDLERGGLTYYTVILGVVGTSSPSPLRSYIIPYISTL